MFSFQFLGNTEVEAPKGTEVVKDAVRKLKVKASPRSKLQSVLGRPDGTADSDQGEVGVSDKCSPPSSVTNKVPLEFFQLPECGCL